MRINVFIGLLPFSCFQSYFGLVACNTTFGSVKYLPYRPRFSFALSVPAPRAPSVPRAFCLAMHHRCHHRKNGIRGIILPFGHNHILHSKNCNNFQCKICANDENEQESKPQNDFIYELHTIRLSHSPRKPPHYNINVWASATFFVHIGKYGHSFPWLAKRFDC